MSTLQKTNLAPGTKRFPIFTLFTRYSEHNGPFFSLSARPRRPQTVCAIEEALTHPTAWVMLLEQQATMSSTKEKPKSWLLHLNTKPKRLNNTSPLSCILFFKTTCTTFKNHQGPSNTKFRLVLSPAKLTLLRLKLGRINCFICEASLSKLSWSIMLLSTS